ARWNPHFDRFGAQHAAVAMAGGADALQLSCTATARAGEVELHRARHLAHVPGAIALGTLYCASPRSGLGSVTGFANLLMGDAEANLRASNGLPEIDIQRVLQVCAGLRGGGFFGLPAALEELRKQVAKSAAGFGIG